jgi:hypothetical protein
MAHVAQTLPLISRVRRHIPVATMIFVLTQSWVSIVTTMRLCRASFRCHPVAHASRTLHCAELVPFSRTNIADEMREEASAASALRLMVEN